MGSEREQGPIPEPKTKVRKLRGLMNGDWPGKRVPSEQEPVDRRKPPEILDRVRGKQEKDLAPEPLCQKKMEASRYLKVVEGFRSAVSYWLRKGAVAV